MLEFCEVCDNALAFRVEDGTVSQACTVCKTASRPRRGVHVMWETKGERSDDSVDHYMTELIHHDPTIPYIETKCPSCGVTGRVRYVKRHKRLAFMYSCEACRAYWNSGARSARRPECLGAADKDGGQDQEV